MMECQILSIFFHWCVCGGVLTAREGRSSKNSKNLDFNYVSPLKQTNDNSNSISCFSIQIQAALQFGLQLIFYFLMLHSHPTFRKFHCLQMRFPNTKAASSVCPAFQQTFIISQFLDVLDIIQSSLSQQRTSGFSFSTGRTFSLIYSII